MKTLAIIFAAALAGCAQTTPRCTGIDPSCSGGGYSARSASKPAAGKPIGISKPTPSKPTKSGHSKGDKNHSNHAKGKK